MKQPVYLIHSNEYKNWIFDPSHPTQGRRFDNARDLFLQLAKRKDIDVVEISPNLVHKGELLRVHTAKYIEEVLEQHHASEWVGEREDLAILASRFVQGTLNALDNLMVGDTKLAIHFPGAKHHAQADHSSGFCVFADFAIAADIATEYGKKVAILDIDGHHGDGTENLTKDNLNVLTFSIHEFGIFPGTGYVSYPEKHVYNYPLGSTEPGHNPNKDDKALLNGVSRFCELATQFNPDLLFIACGADGHREDPLTNLEYSVDGYIAVAKRLKERFPDLPILLGGAGGYLPDTITPQVWANVADTFANLINIKPSNWFNVGMVKARLDETLKQFKNGKDPAPFELEIEDKDLQIWVRFKIDPKRFSPKIFEGEWAFTTQHPEIGKIRVIKAITGEDGVARLIARQGRFIYAYPWFE